MKTNLPALITETPEDLITPTRKIEKQICILCSYTGCCRLIKTPHNTDAQMQLTAQVTEVLDSILKRIETD